MKWCDKYATDGMHEVKALQPESGIPEMVALDECCWRERLHLSSANGIE
jgi:hypothetical protein